MKRILLLTFIAVITFALFAFFKNPELLKDIWIWLIGFAGLIIQAGKSLMEYFRSFIEKSEQVDNKENAPAAAPKTISNNKNAVTVADPNSVQLSLLRFHDDGQTTLGLLYVNNNFYCYTLEDTKREIKKDGETRIPTGYYEVNFLQEKTDMTKKYQLQFPDWFTYHLHLKNVPGFSRIYIHNGGTHKDTRGCILVSDSLNIAKDNTFLSNSKKTFEMLYKFLFKEISDGKKIYISVKNESWFSNLKK
jgi:uncharacterized protein (UPF0333 family)